MSKDLRRLKVPSPTSTVEAGGAEFAGQGEGGGVLGGAYGGDVGVELWAAGLQVLRVGFGLGLEG